MKSNKANIPTLRAALRTASKAARLKAFRKGLPVAVSRGGKVVFIYKDNKEIPLKTPKRQPAIK